jgi:hypothetical protein
MGVLFNEQLRELFVYRLVVGVLYHAKGQSLVNGVVGKIMLQGKAAQPLGRKRAFGEFHEIAAFHQRLNSGMNDFAKQ